MSSQYYLKSDLALIFKNDDRIFDFIQKYALDGLWFWNVNDRQVEWINPKLIKVLDYQDKEDTQALNLQIARICSDATLASINYSVNQESICSLPFDYYHANGLCTAMNCTLLNIYDSDNKHIGILGANSTVQTEVNTDLEVLVANMTSLIISLDNQGNITYVSPNVKHFCELTPSEVLGKSFYNFIYQESILIDQIYHSVFNQLPIQNFEIKLLKCNNNYFWANINSSINPVNQETILVISDITERVNQQNENIKQKQFISDCKRLAKVGGWEIDVNTLASYWTQITKEIHEVPDDYEPDITTGINFYKEGESRETITRVVERAINYGEDFDVELQIITAKGREIWVRAIGKADFSNPDKKRVYGVFQDIDKIKKITLDNIKVNALLKNLSLQVSGVLHITKTHYNGERSILYVSKNFLKIDGFEDLSPSDKFITFARCIHPDDLLQVREKTNQAIEKFTELDYTFRLRLPNGEAKWVQSTASPERTEDGIIWYGYMKDISKAKQIELELLKTKKLLQETNQIAKIGGWERNLSTDEANWSDYTKTLFGINKRFQPTLENLVYFFKEGEHRNAISHALKRCVMKGQSFNIEAEMTNADGEEIWVRLIGNADFNDPNNKRIYGSIQDITLIKMIELSRDKANLMLNRLSMQLPGVLYQFEICDNGQTNILYFSSNFFRIEGFENLSAREKSEEFLRIVHPDDLGLVSKNMVKAAKQLTSFEYEYRIRLNTGEERWMHSMANPERTQSSVIFHGYLYDVTDRKQIEQELKLTKEFLQETSRIAKVGGWELDINTQKSIRSEVIRDILELPENTDESYTIAPYIKEGKNRDLSIRVSEECVKTGKSFDIQLEAITAKGKPIWVRAMGNADFSNPLKKRVSGIFQDITELKTLEIEREKAGFLLNKLSEQIPGVLFQHNISPDGKLTITYFSKKFALLMGGGFQEQDSLYDSALTMSRVHPDDIIHLAPLLSTQFEKTENKVLYFRVITPHSGIRWIRSETSNDYRNGNIEWYSYLTDATNEKNLTLEIQRIQKLLEDSSRVARLGGWSMEIKDSSIQWSNIIKEIVGVPHHYDPKLEVAVTFYKEGYSRDLVTKSFRECISNGTPFEIEVQITNTNGEDIWVRVVGNAEKQDDKIVRIFGIFQDINHLKLAQFNKDKLIATEVLLAKEKELNLIKSRYLALTSHEFRTPLAAILGSTELIEMVIDSSNENVLSSKILKHSEQIKSQVERLSNIIKDVLSLEEFGNEKYIKNVGTISVCASLLNLVNSSPYKDKLQFNLPEQDKAILFDQSCLNHIINNLINNAFKYSRHQAKNPELSLVFEEKQCKIMVKDYGIGIPENEQKHIFDTFFRASNTIKTEGTGFGLSVAKELAERLGASISFKSKEGVGSTFTLSIPL